MRNIRRWSMQKHVSDLRGLGKEFENAPDVKGAFDGFYSEEVNEKDLTIWIDPLDGSKGFTEGHLHHITCIIGVSIKNRPRLGIVHKPFSTNPYPGCGRTYVGLPESGLYSVDLITDSFGEMISSNPHYIPIFDSGEILSPASF
jgi:3'-phosphoadenosine 5'-phosphosulfate (PAPS) 3'-phosphatase